MKRNLVSDHDAKHNPTAEILPFLSSLIKTVYPQGQVPHFISRVCSNVIREALPEHLYPLLSIPLTVLYSS